MEEAIRVMLQEKTFSAWGSSGGGNAGRNWPLVELALLPSWLPGRLMGASVSVGESVIMCMSEGYCVLCTFACVSVTMSCCV